MPGPANFRRGFQPASPVQAERGLSREGDGGAGWRLEFRLAHPGCLLACLGRNGKAWLAGLVVALGEGPSGGATRGPHLANGRTIGLNGGVSGSSVTGCPALGIWPAGESQAPLVSSPKVCESRIWWAREGRPPAASSKLRSAVRAGRVVAQASTRIVLGTWNSLVPYRGFQHTWARLRRLNPLDPSGLRPGLGRLLALAVRGRTWRPTVCRDVQTVGWQALCYPSDLKGVQAGPAPTTKAGDHSTSGQIRNARGNRRLRLLRCPHRCSIVGGTAWAGPNTTQGGPGSEARTAQWRTSGTTTRCARFFQVSRPPVQRLKTVSGGTAKPSWVGILSTLRRAAPGGRGEKLFSPGNPLS